ncbi:MAG TPA: prepilin-type N-terminal cleavage/methylation domain-containing protein [Thermoanaerobaculia bacterium]|nr:prepilin-type N-terminal cleavage/methylation domain-containing protein [Thermoanaerobaculia bacterium]
MKLNGSRQTLHEQRGFNLIEVMIAMAVMGSVMMSILTLFFLSQRNVYSGKQMTQAVAVGTRVLEDLSTMTTDVVYANLNITNATPRLASPPAIGGEVYANSAIITVDTTTAYTTTNDPGGYFARWQALLNSNRFTDGRLFLVLTPTDPVTSATPFSSAQFLRIKGIVEWNEATRRRRAIFDTAKSKRP